MRGIPKEGQDKFVGADITLAKYIANKLGLELEIKSMNFDVVLTALDSDKADLAISGFTYSDSRAASYLFSESYFLEGEGDQIIVTTKANASKYSSLADFNKPEIKIAAQAASVQKDLVVAQLPNAFLVEITDLQNALTALEAGTYDAVAMSYNLSLVRLPVPPRPHIGPQGRSRTFSKRATISRATVTLHWGYGAPDRNRTCNLLIYLSILSYFLLDFS